jgi:rare lipoprotein A
MVLKERPKRVLDVRRTRALWIGLVALTLLAGCGGPEPRPHYKIGPPYQIDGTWYRPQFVTEYEATGIASWYGEAFDGRYTANGEVYDMAALTAAHPTLPLPSLVQVTNLANGRSLLVRVNDRGPFVADRLIDLSQAAASELGFERAGLARVQVVYLGLAQLDDPPIYPGETRQYAIAQCVLPRPRALVC